MKLSTLFTINAIVAILFGLGFLLIPATLLSWYGVDLPDAGIFISRLLGAAFVTFATISWETRSIESAAGSVTMRAILLGFFIGDILGALISMIYQVEGIANALGWTTVLIYLLLGLGFGFFALKAGTSET